MSDKGIICYFSLLLVNQDHFQLTSTVSRTLLLVELMVIKHGHHIVASSYWRPRGGCFSYSWHSLMSCAMPPTLFNASNIPSIENLLIRYHFKCYETSQAFTINRYGFTSTFHLFPKQLLPTDKFLPI